MIIPWHIILEEIETTVRIGIHPQEATPQRILVNAFIIGQYALRPRNITECVNYDMIHELITHEWPKRDHVDLLEMLAVDLFEFIFTNSPQATAAHIGIYKPDIFTNAKKVGVELEITREGFMAT